MSLNTPKHFRRWKFKKSTFDDGGEMGCDRVLTRACLLLIAFLLLSNARGSFLRRGAGGGDFVAVGRQGGACRWRWKVGRWDPPRWGGMGLPLRGGFEEYDWSQRGPCGGCGNIPRRQLAKNAKNKGRAFYSCFGQVLPCFWIRAGEG